jgi:hypothetical protein
MATKLIKVLNRKIKDLKLRQELLKNTKDIKTSLLKL